MSSVHLSVRLSVRYRDHIGRNSSKIISRPNSLGPVTCVRADPNMGDLVQREHPQNWGGIGVVNLTVGGLVLLFLVRGRGKSQRHTACGTNCVRTADAIIRGPRSAAFLADRSEQVH